MKIADSDREAGRMTPIGGAVVANLAAPGASDVAALVVCPICGEQTAEVTWMGRSMLQQANAALRQRGQAPLAESDIAVCNRQVEGRFPCREVRAQQIAEWAHRVRPDRRPAPKAPLDDFRGRDDE